MSRALSFLVSTRQCFFVVVHFEGFLKVNSVTRLTAQRVNARTEGQVSPLCLTLVRLFVTCFQHHGTPQYMLVLLGGSPQMFFHVAIQQNFINKVGAYIWYPEGGRLTELSFQNDFMIFHAC